MAQVHEASIEGLTTMVNRERMAQSGTDGSIGSPRLREHFLRGHPRAEPASVTAITHRRVTGKSRPTLNLQRGPFDQRPSPDADAAGDGHGWAV
jgi:hypothetical protein